MTDREFYEKRIKPLIEAQHEAKSEIGSWECLSELDRAQISEIRREEERVM